MSAQLSKKYLSAAQIREIIGEIIFDPSFTPMSQDTYNEDAVAKTISATGKASQLAMAAVNMAAVGYGNKKYGQFKFKDAIVEIVALLQSCHVKVGLGKDAKLSESDLTPQRLCRAFRHEIRQYLQDTKFETYIYRKYSNHDPKFATICFRGSEYLDDLTSEECNFLLNVYAELDRAKGTNILERVKRVFQAKGKLPRVVQI
jgi:hypothetical protein